MKEPSKITNFMDWVPSKHNKESIMENSNTDWKMAKENSHGAMDLITKVIIEKIKEMEQDFLNQNKEVSKENGRMIKLKEQDIW